MATTQKVSAVVRKTGLPRGGWSQSGRVKGWGSRFEGFEIEAEKDVTYQCRICYGVGNHVFEPRWNPRCTSGTWRKRSKPTGTVFVRWHEGERHSNRDADESIAKIAQALRDAGLDVELTGREVTVR